MSEEHRGKEVSVSTSMMRIRTLDDGLLRSWQFLGLVLSSTLSRRTEEVLIKFTVGHFVPPSDWLPSILSFLPFPITSPNLYVSSSSSACHSLEVYPSFPLFPLSVGKTSTLARRKLQPRDACVATFFAKEIGNQIFCVSFASQRCFSV